MNFILIYKRINVPFWIVKTTEFPRLQRVMHVIVNDIDSMDRQGSPLGAGKYKY